MGHRDATQSCGFGARLAIILTAAVVIAASMAACGDAETPTTPTASAAEAAADAVDVLRNGTRSEREGAARELGTMADPAVVPALIDALTDDAWSVRSEAVAALSPWKDPRAVMPLLDLIAVAPVSPAVADTDLFDAQATYRGAIEALGAIGDARAAPRLIEIAAVDDVTPESVAANDALGQIGPSAVPAAAAALEGVSAARGPIVVELLAALGPTALDPLTGALQHPRAVVRVAAAEALGAMGTPAIDPLIAALKQKSVDVRNAAARSLGSLGATRATGTLVAMLSTTGTRAAATSALVAIYRDDATPLLKYLKAKKTVRVYEPLIRIGQKNTVDKLVAALKKFGTKSMGEDYLNSGNATLEKAAKAWGKAHGYSVITMPGFGSDPWGTG